MTIVTGKRWLTREGGAVLLDISVRTFDRLMQSEDAPSPLRLRPSVRYDEDALLNFMNKRAGEEAA
jgi:predicted DNA-binding transcriptional regulator AlpA